MYIRSCKFICKLIEYFCVSFIIYNKQLAKYLQIIMKTCLSLTNNDFQFAV